ncbi:hypothetical protein WMO64_12100 [Pseudoflavonifractor sp. CLA-AP-H29]|uniref:Uncharacterized protein n=1 Tax=Pseudoflavonifractor intestinihominis TaxID=3133171 RepID=A0ABV1EA95_9FIRM
MQSKLTHKRIYKVKDMKKLELILANMIRSGKVTVEIPGIEHIEAAMQEESRQMLWEIAGIVFSDEMEDGEKIACLREMLEP